MCDISYSYMRHETFTCAGNTIDGDGCNVMCRIEECGNGVVDFGEECDGSNTCTPTCEHECMCDVGDIMSRNGVKLPDSGNVLLLDTVEIQCNTGHCCFPASHLRCLNHIDGKQGFSLICGSSTCSSGVPRLGTFENASPQPECAPCQCTWNCPALTLGTMVSPAQGAQLDDRLLSGGQWPDWDRPHSCKGAYPARTNTSFYLLLKLQPPSRLSRPFPRLNCRCTCA